MTPSLAAARRKLPNRPSAVVTRVSSPLSPYAAAACRQAEPDGSTASTAKAPAPLSIARRTEASSGQSAQLPARATATAIRCPSASSTMAATRGRSAPRLRTASARASGPIDQFRNAASAAITSPLRSQAAEAKAALRIRATPPGVASAARSTAPSSTGVRSTASLKPSTSAANASRERRPGAARDRRAMNRAAASARLFVDVSGGISRTRWSLNSPRPPYGPEIAPSPPFSPRQGIATEFVRKSSDAAEAAVPPASVSNQKSLSFCGRTPHPGAEPPALVLSVDRIEALASMCRSRRPAPHFTGDFSMSLRLQLAGSALALATLLGGGAHAATLFSLTGPTAAQPTETNYVVNFQGAGGTGVLDFILDGYGTLDGAGIGQDDFALNVNGTNIAIGTFNMGGVGSDNVYFGPFGSSYINLLPNPTPDNATGAGGKVHVTSNIALLTGLNSITFSYNSETGGAMIGPQGIGDEGWGIEALTVTGDALAPPTGDLAGAVPEPTSWALMVMGFGGLGAMLRRRTFRAAVAG